MKIKLVIISFLLFSVLLSCETPSGDTVPVEDAGGEVYHAEVSSIVMPDTILFSDTLFVALRVRTNHGIHKLSHVVLDRNSGRINAKVYGVLVNPYPTVMGSYSADIKVYPVDPGVFTVGVIQPHNALWEETVFVVAEKVKD
jgi:hypothetical protein